MAYWIQEIVSTGGGSRVGRRMYHCDYVSDIEKLPLNDKEGTLQNNDTISHTKARFGDMCLCLEDSSVWELGNDSNEWKKL